MRNFIISLALVSVSLAVSCDVQSGITKKSVEEFQPTPTPVVAPVLEHPPVNPAEVVQVDATLQGDIISVNKDGEKKTIACDKYNQVMINSSETVVTITGGCRQLMINGNDNDVTAEAVMTVFFNGERNKFKYAKYGNGKRPVVTNNKLGNSIEKIDAPAKK